MEMRDKVVPLIDDARTKMGKLILNNGVKYLKIS